MTDAPLLTPRQALAKIEKLCNDTAWILSANDIRPILASVQPVMLTDVQEERLEYLESLEADLVWAQKFLARLATAGLSVKIHPFALDDLEPQDLTGL